MQTWPQNVGNRISEDLIFTIFRGGMPPDPLQGNGFGGPKKRTPFCKILDPPQGKQSKCNRDESTKTLADKTNFVL